MASGDVPNSVKEARDRFDLFSDANLASRLQDQEFGAHFNANRQERRLVGSDTKVSREEQMAEMQRQAALRREHLSRVAETDEEIARRLQEEFNREEEVKRFLAQKQADDDARMARQLQEQEQGRIVGYGPSSTNVPTSSTSSGALTGRRSSNPHHIYAAQNNLNEHYAVRASTSLIDLSAEEALATLPSPPSFHPPTNIDPFLTPDERRVAAYVPSNAVPLLPPPPEFVVRREQERAMEELNRLQPRLALAGLASGNIVSPQMGTVAPSTPISPSSAYTVPPVYPSLPSVVTVAPSATAPVSPPPAYTAPSIYTPPPHSHSAPLVTVTTPTPTGVRLTETNPFLIDLIGQESGRSATTGGGDFFSEFGLPAPSSLAMGDSRGTGGYSHSLI